MNAALVCAALLAASATIAAPAPPAAAQPSPAVADTQRLHALFERHWEESARHYPEWATWRGDARFGDRFTDASPAGRAANDAWTRDLLREAEAVPVQDLSATDRVSRELFIHDLADDVRLQAYPGWRSRTLVSQWGFQSGFAGLLQASPVSSVAEVRQMLARLAAYPVRVDQEIVRLRDGLALGWASPRPVLERVLRQIDGQLPPDVADSPFYAPFKGLGAAIPAAEQDTLRAQARQAIANQVYPALRKLRAFAAAECLPKAPPDGALARYPGGVAVYAELVRQHTTTDLTPQQIHDIGRIQIRRLRGEMEAAMRDTGFKGDFPAFIVHLNSDPKFFHASPDALIAAYRDIAKRVDPELPKLFAELPRMPYGVRALPSHLGPGAADTYDGPSLDGRRAGWFNANVAGYRTTPVWGMETLVAHEAVPGHHLQTARAAELGDLPPFRRASFYTVYAEGWALYAETLGSQLGLYTDPASRFGHLQWQAFRAARLVVDTGVHALGWSREQAIDYMVEQTGVERNHVATEVDRYYSDPGQALAYMIGELKIIELRDRARARLGPRFDIRRFHNALLDQGSVPLPVLERIVDEWIAAQAAQPAQ
jgi:uncharacterized protein (DUF885 family)